MPPRRAPGAGARGKPAAAEPAFGGGDLGRCLGLDPQMIDGSVRAGPFEQHQLEWRIGDGEVGIAGADLGGLGVEHGRVEGDGRVEIVDVEG